jgi:hypothetical protein
MIIAPPPKNLHFFASFSCPNRGGGFLGFSLFSASVFAVLFAFFSLNFPRLHEPKMIYGNKAEEEFSACER